MPKTIDPKRLTNKEGTRGWLKSEPVIYNTTQWDGIFKGWQKDDLVTIFQPLYAEGYQWSLERSVLEIPATRLAGYMSMATPWCHARGTAQKHCNMDHHIIFKNWHIIHPRCQNCWKVCITPKNFLQLLQLEQLQLDMDVASKCGIELRDYTPKHYGGYFYTSSLEQGRERYHQVRKEIDKRIDGGKDMSVILKRGCTEYEMVKGPSPFWCNTRDEEEMLELIEAYVDVGRGNTSQPRIMKDHIRMKWILWAHANGDMSYKVLNGGNSLYPDYVHYEEGDIDGIKADLAMARAHTIGKLDSKLAFKFLNNVNEFAKEHDTTPEQLSETMKGHEGLPHHEISIKALGDHDETT